MHAQQPILIPAAPPTGHRARLMLQRVLLLALPVAVVIAAIALAATLL